jgi:hypothetical protein
VCARRVGALLRYGSGSPWVDAACPVRIGLEYGDAYTKNYGNPNNVEEQGSWGSGRFAHGGEGCGEGDSAFEDIRELRAGRKVRCEDSSALEGDDRIEAQVEGCEGARFNQSEGGLWCENEGS